MSMQRAERYKVFKTYFGRRVPHTVGSMGGGQKQPNKLSADGCCTVVLSVDRVGYGEV